MSRFLEQAVGACGAGGTGAGSIGSPGPSSGGEGAFGALGAGVEVALLPSLPGVTVGLPPLAGVSSGSTPPSSGVAVALPPSLPGVTVALPLSGGKGCGTTPPLPLTPSLSCGGREPLTPGASRAWARAAAIVFAEKLIISAKMTIAISVRLDFMDAFLLVNMVLRRRRCSGWHLVNLPDCSLMVL